VTHGVLVYLTRVFIVSVPKSCMASSFDGFLSIIAKQAATSASSASARMALSSMGDSGFHKSQGEMDFFKFPWAPARSILSRQILLE